MQANIDDVTNITVDMQANIDDVTNNKMDTQPI